MLALIRTLGPVVALVIGMIGGGTMIGGLGAAYNIWIDNPQVAREATNRANDACTIRTMDAANRAQAAERSRQEAAAHAAEDAYQAAIEARQKLVEATQDALAQQEADYQQQIDAQGRQCTLDDGDLKFLRGTK